jgi:hypothetical protein
MVGGGEKVDNQTATVVVHTPRPQKSKWRVLGLVALLASVFAVAARYADPSTSTRSFLSTTLFGHHGGAKLCPQSDVLYPERHAQLWRSLGLEFAEDAFTKRAVAWLGGAVRILYVLAIVLCACGTSF